MASRLNPGEQLTAGDQLISDSGLFKLTMQGDGNLVEYRTDTGQALWASNTMGSGSNRAAMQGDGNFVLYDANGKPHWDTHTYNHAGAYVVLQGDGNVVVYNQGGAALWNCGVVINPNHKYIGPQAAKWENDYYSIASVDYDPDTRLARVGVDLTNTFKFAGFIAGTKVMFYGSDQQLISSADNSLYCPQAPIIGAAHQSIVWSATAPPGTEALGLLQYYRDVGLAQLGHDVEQAVVDIGTALGDAGSALNKWAGENPEAFNAIVISLLVIGVVLCVSFPASCEVVFVEGGAILKVVF